MADKTKGLVDYLMADPTLTAQQKVITVLQVHGAQLVTDEEARRYLLGEQGRPESTCRYHDHDASDPCDCR